MNRVLRNLSTADESKAFVPAHVAALPVGARACPRENTDGVPQTGVMLDVRPALHRWTRSTGRWLTSPGAARSAFMTRKISEMPRWTRCVRLLACPPD